MAREASDAVSAPAMLDERDNTEGPFVPLESKLFGHLLLGPPLLSK